MRRYLLLALLGAQGVAAHAATAQRSGDSAGVRVVRYSAATTGSDIVLSNPALASSGDGCELNRAVGLAVQASGDIVVANGGNFELCVFDAGGRFLRKMGRKGEGPGEFRSIQAMHSFHGDSILTVDPMLRRVSVFGPTGTIGRSFTIATPDTGLGSNSFTGALGDGTLLMGFSEFKSGPPRPEAVMFYQRLFHTSPAGARLAMVGTFPIGEHFIQHTVPEMGGVAYWTLAFGRAFSAAPLGDGFVGGDGSDFSIREYESTGKLRAIHRVDLERRPVTPDDIAAYRADELKTTKEAQRPLAERMLAEMPFPTHFPAYHRVITDDAGRIWIDPVPPRGSSGTRWLRLDPTTGRAQGVQFPNRFRLLAVRGGRACGIGRDDVDLETAYCFALPR